MPNDADILYALFDTALKAALPDGQFEGRLPEKPRGRTIVLGAGKASARMAAAFEEAWGRAGGTCEGLVVTRYGHAVPTRSVEIVEAAHPVPDEAGLQAAKRILALARDADPDDLVVCLMSGGASALLSLPADGVTLADKQDLNRALLKSGAPIGEMNLVRKSLSAIKGGRLAAAAGRAQLVTYLISDVPGDDPSSIGSGPTIPERVDPDVALSILRKYGIDCRCKGPRVWPDATRSRRCARRRGTGGRTRHGRHRALGADAWRARKITLRTALGRRDDGDGSRPGAGRAQCGIPVGACSRAEGRDRNCGHRLRYGRHRRIGG